jgi:large subunit ribosomal protein L32
MSALPKRRISHSRKNNRRSHHSLKPIKLVSCPNCSAKMLPHNACNNCGKYNGKTVLPI